MLIYNQTTLAFISRIKIYLREVAAELGLEYRTSRLHLNGISYPITLVVFEGEQRLGFYDAHCYRLGINLKLVYLANSSVIREIIKHELAHFLTSVFYPQALTAHGEEFTEICQRFNLPHDVSAATINLEIANEQFVDQRSEKVLRLVKKLLALASSQNAHEAEAATAKANALLLKHNLELIDLRRDDPQEADQTFVHTVLSAKRQSAKLHAIYQILTTFFVYPVFLQGKEGVRLEVIGNRASVELAEYVANFLDQKLEDLWNEAKNQNAKLKGTTAKNSFFKGVAQGHSLRIQNEQIMSSGKELIILKQDLKRRVAQVYSRLGSSSSRSSGNCHESHAQGIKAGSKLSINPALGQDQKAGKKLLSFFKK